MAKNQLKGKAMTQALRQAMAQFSRARTLAEQYEAILEAQHALRVARLTEVQWAQEARWEKEISRKARRINATE